MFLFLYHQLRPVLLPQYPLNLEQKKTQKMSSMTIKQIASGKITKAALILSPFLHAHHSKHPCESKTILQFTQIVPKISNNPQFADLGCSVSKLW